MKLILTIFSLCIAPVIFSQSATKINIADSGKAEFKKQAAAENPDYSIAYRILKNQVKQYPNNAELLYFLAYAADRINSEEGSTMYQMKKDLTIEASEYLERVNKLQPVYKGEFVVLDPYSKLSSIWGSLAQSYLVRNLNDSATWAFTEGKKRGGFIEPMLHYNRQLLNSCSKNAILFSAGDNVTIPIWYLQTVENLRTDITVADVNLINTSWYCKYLKNDRKLDISFTDEEIDSVDFVSFEARYITLTNPKDSAEKFTWNLKPTYYNRYLLKGDRIMLNILKENLFERDVFFSSIPDSTWNLFLGDYITKEGLVHQLQIKGIDFDEAPDKVSSNFSIYSIEKIDAAEIKKSKDAILLLNNYRWAYYSAIAGLLSKNQKPKARVLKNEMELKFSLTKLPFAFDGAAGYFKKLFSEID